ncbi:hypothetical protein L208DRAFT_1310812, partial [Tricholoma matsutake]
YVLHVPSGNYANYKFVSFYWRSFVQEARKPWKLQKPSCINHPEKISIFKSNGCVIGLSPVHVYIF